MAEKNLYTVIVADDEDELREAVCTMIPWEALGFHLVGSASNGLDALELVEQLEPDLLLTDIRMPFITGIELARQVREIRPIACWVVMLRLPPRCCPRPGPHDGRHGGPDVRVRADAELPARRAVLCFRVSPDKTP